MRMMIVVRRSRIVPRYSLLPIVLASTAFGVQRVCAQGDHHLDATEVSGAIDDFQKALDER